MALSRCDPLPEKARVTYKPICLVSQSRCEVDTKIGVFTVKFAVENSVITETPFNIEVSYFQKGGEALKINQGKEVLKVNKISAYLEGKEMFMGKIPVLFSSSSPLSSRKEHHFVGETMLGSCSEEKMTWRLWISAEIKNITTADIVSQTFFIDFDSTRYKY